VAASSPIRDNLPPMDIKDVTCHVMAMQLVSREAFHIILLLGSFVFTEVTIDEYFQNSVVVPII